MPTAAAYGCEQAPWLEAYDHFGPYAFAGRAQAERALEVAQQAHEARRKRWLGRGTVRSMAAGTHSTQLTDLRIPAPAALQITVSDASIVQLIQRRLARYGTP